MYIEVTASNIQAAESINMIQKCFERFRQVVDNERL